MKQARIIVLAGQSNAVGVGFTKYLPEHFDADTVAQFHRGYDRIRISYECHDIRSEGFVPTRVNCTEATKDTLGPEVGIARALSRAYPDEDFYIVKCAFGATSLHYDWRPPSSGVPFRRELTAEPARALVDPAFRFEGWCYNACVKRLEEAFAELRGMGLEPRVHAFCWMQGEGDSAAPHAEPYIGRYDGLLSDLRETFVPAFDGCTYVDAGISQVWEDYEGLNARKRAYAEEKGAGYRFVDTVAAGLTTKNEPYEEPDIYHYDVESTVRLGELFAQAWLDTCPTL